MTRFGFVSLIAVSALSLAACSSNDHQVTAQEYDDIAQNIGSTTAHGGGGGDVGSMKDVIQLSLGTMPIGLSIDAKGHISGNKLGLTYDYQVTCSDASGAAQATCGKTTDRADIQVAWTGNLALPNLTASVDRHGEWKLAGLQSDKITLDGDGTFTLDADVKSIVRPAEATYHLAYQGSYAAVVFDTVQQAPVSGTIHYAIAAKHTETAGQNTSTATFDVDAEITFQGGGKASLVIDGSQHYTIDLATGVVIHA
jgi:Putative Ig domain